MSTDRTRALLGALSKGECPGLSLGEDRNWTATLILIPHVFPQGQKGEPGEMVSGPGSG